MYHAKFQARLRVLRKDPLWKGKPFWLLNFFELKRDAEGSTADALVQFRGYIRGAQKHAERLGVQSWFANARLISYNCHSCFEGESHGRFDCCVMYEYASPEAFVATVAANADYKTIGAVRAAAVVREVQVAVKPTVLMDAPDAITPAQRADADKFADEFWRAAVAAKPAQTGSEEQTIHPKPQTMAPVMRNAALMSGPFFALNVRLSLPASPAPASRAEARAEASLRVFRPLPRPSLPP